MSEPITEQHSHPEVPRASVAAWITTDVITITAAAASWGFAFSTFFLLPKFLVQELSAGPKSVGLVTGVFAIATVLLTPLAGRTIDRYPHGWSIAVGSVMMAVSAIAFMAIESIGWLIVALRLLQAASHALVFTAVSVAIAERVPSSRLAQAMGLSGACMLVMNAIAPAIVEPLAAAAGWHSVFALAAIAAVGSAAAATRIAPSPTAHSDKEDAGGYSLCRLLARPLTIHYAAVVTMAGVAFGAMFTFHQPFALAHGLSDIGGFFVAFASSAFAIRVFLGHLPDRLGRHRVAVASLVVYTIAVVAMALVGPLHLAPIGVIFGLSHGLFYPAINAIALSAVPRFERGRMMAIFTGAFNLGLAATTALGVVADSSGYPMVFALAAAALVAATVILVWSVPLREASKAGRAAAGVIVEPRPNGVCAPLAAVE